MAQSIMLSVTSTSLANHQQRNSLAIVLRVGKVRITETPGTRSGYCHVAMRPELTLVVLAVNFLFLQESVNCNIVL